MKTFKAFEYKGWYVMGEIHSHSGAVTVTARDDADFNYIKSTYYDYTMAEIRRRICDEIDRQSY